MLQTELVQLTFDELRGLAELPPPAHFADVPEGAPPPHVAARAECAVPDRKLGQPGGTGRLYL